MLIFRYADPEGAVHHGLLHPDGSRERLKGSLFEQQRPSGEVAAVARLLAPLQPRALLCIGLNYRRHAAETGATIPQRPVLFMKSPGRCRILAPRLSCPPAWPATRWITRPNWRW